MVDEQGSERVLTPTERSELERVECIHCGAMQTHRVCWDCFDEQQAAQ